MVDAGLLIDDLNEVDLPAVLAIYNDVIATTTAVYSERPTSLEERTAWWRSKREQGFPVLVARADRDVVGFAACGDFRAWPCYRYTVEHSVHVAPEHRRRGVGKQLVEELILRAVADGKHVMIGGIDAQNRGSIRLHEELGFSPAGTLREVGYKFDRWLDLMFMQRTLVSATPPTTASSPRPTGSASAD